MVREDKMGGEQKRFDVEIYTLGVTLAPASGKVDNEMGF